MTFPSSPGRRAVALAAFLAAACQRDAPRPPAGPDAAPPPAPDTVVAALPGRPLPALNTMEALQDGFESYLDGLCGRLKAGERTFPTDVVVSRSLPELKGLAFVTSCSLRALRFDPAENGASTSGRLLFEVDGFSADGLRRTQRGEGDFTAEIYRPAWRLTSFTPGWEQVVERPRRGFVELTDRAGMALPEAAAPQTGADGNLVPLFPDMRAGLAVIDLDGDGLLDVVASDLHQLFVFRNQGAMAFKPERIEGLPEEPSYAGLAAGDFDGDGDPDVVATVHSSKWEKAAVSSFVLRNDQGKLVPAGRLPLSAAGPISTALATDFDRDGKLDLVLLRYGAEGGPTDWLQATDGDPPLFLRGNGDLTFTPVELTPPRKGFWGLGAVAGELVPSPGRQVYVANDYGRNDLWSFGPGGKITEIAAAHGLEDPGFGMSADLGDVNADGRLDLYVGNMFSKAGTRVIQAAALSDAERARVSRAAGGNTLYVSRLDGSFREEGQERGVNRGLWAFASIFLDFDDDARLDLAVANGFISRPNRKDL